MTPNRALYAQLERIKREQGEEAYQLAIEKINENDKKLWKKFYLPFFVITIPLCIVLLIYALALIVK